MKIRFFSVAMVGLMMFASCVKDIESDSVTSVRNAKAAELNSVATYNNALAAAATITANAEAALKAAQAEYQKAQAELVKAQAELANVKTEEEKITLEKLILDLEKAKAQSAADLQRIAHNMELEMEQYKLQLLQAQQAYNNYAQTLAEGQRERLITVSGNYTTQMEELLKLQRQKIEFETEIAEVEAGLKTAEEGMEAYIAEQLERVSFIDEQIAVMEKYIQSDFETLQAAWNKAYLAYEDASLAYNEADAALTKADLALGKASDAVENNDFRKALGMLESLPVAKTSKDGYVGYNDAKGFFVPLWKGETETPQLVIYKRNILPVYQVAPVEFCMDNVKGLPEMIVAEETKVHEKSLNDIENSKAAFEMYAENYRKAVESAFPEAKQAEVKAAYEEATAKIEEAAAVREQAKADFKVARETVAFSEGTEVYLAEKALESAEENLDACKEVLKYMPKHINHLNNRINGVDIKDEGIDPTLKGGVKAAINKAKNRVDNVLKPALKTAETEKAGWEDKLTKANATLAAFKLDELDAKVQSTYLEYLSHKDADDAKKYEDAWNNAVKAYNDVIASQAYIDAKATVNDCQTKFDDAAKEVSHLNKELAASEKKLGELQTLLADLTEELSASEEAYAKAQSEIDALKAGRKEARAAYREALNATHQELAALYDALKTANDNLETLVEEKDAIAFETSYTAIEFGNIELNGRELDWDYDEEEIEILVPGSDSWSEKARMAYIKALEALSLCDAHIAAFEKGVELENAEHAKVLSLIEDVKSLIVSLFNEFEPEYLAAIETALSAQDEYVAAWKAVIDADEVKTAAEVELDAVSAVFDHDANINGKIEDLRGEQAAILSEAAELIKELENAELDLADMKAMLPAYDAKIAAQEKVVEELKAELDALLAAE